MLRKVKRLIANLIDLVYYRLLSEKQRKFILKKIPTRVKNVLKKSANGERSRKRNQLLSIKYHLYNLGFKEQGLADLHRFYEETSDIPLKRMAAWELMLWYANKYTVEDARKALSFYPDVIESQKDIDARRKALIIKAECHDILGEKEEGKAALSVMLAEHQHPDLFLAAANLEDDFDIRVTWINKAMEFYNLEPIHFEASQEVTYDDIANANVNDEVTNGPLVSVILPAYNAEDGIDTAIRSILNQTWRNIELIVVDDCSIDRTVDVIKEFKEKDDRIKLFSTPVNSGPYIARNIALQHASGDYVTVNDSDDWSHVRKLEIQAKHLMANPKVIANTSEHARLLENLKFYRRGTPGKYIFPNMSSIMFRRKPVLEKIGYWDSVRFAGDGEFKRRLVRTFGKQSYIDLNTGPLSLPRQSTSSLTGSSAFGYNGFFMGVRREYVEGLENFHEKSDSLYYAYPQKERPFAVPEPMWPAREKKENGVRKFDAVIASDFRKADATVLQEIKQRIAESMRVGIIQMNSYGNSTKDILPEVRTLINEEDVRMLVYGEKVSCDELVIMTPEVLVYKQEYIPEVKAAKVKVRTNDPTKDYLSHKKLLKSYFDSIGTWIALQNNSDEQ